MFCHKCGKELASDARLCTWCGAAVIHTKADDVQTEINERAKRHKRRNRLLFVCVAVLFLATCAMVLLLVFGRSPLENSLPAAEVKTLPISREALIGSWLCYESVEPGREDDIEFFCILSDDGRTSIGHAVPNSDIFYSDYRGTWEIKASDIIVFQFPNDGLEITASIMLTEKGLRFSSVTDDWLEVRTDCEYRQNWAYYDWTEEYEAQLLNEQLEKSNVGDIISFGSYEQDNIQSNGAERIEWYILAKDSDSMVLLSLYALDVMPYNDTYLDTTWETCSLRTWLNRDFYETAFNANEKLLIKQSVVTADKNPSFKTDSGRDTQDKVSLLSIPEANQYLEQTTAVCYPTNYAKSRDTEQVEPGNSVHWWLRAPGLFTNTAACMFDIGVVSDTGYSVDWQGIYVRPTVRISLN